MNDHRKNLVILSEMMPLGGTSTFALNLCEGMRGSTSWKGSAAGLRDIGEIGKQMRASGLTVFGPAAKSVLHEERIEDIYQNCASIAANAVVAGLGPGSFEFLRFVPDGCLRIGMIQSDDECVYQLLKCYLPWLDLVGGVSLEICRKMEALMGKARIPVVHQPYGVPMPDQLPIRQPGAPLRILYLGRVVEEQKRVGLMSRVMKKTLGSGADIRWTIVGDGPDLDRMRKDFSEESDRVSFLGAVPYSDVAGILTRNDVYFLCSDYEGLPLSLLEAMGAGLVPVVSDLPSGISEVVTDANGIRVAIDDEEGFAKAVIDLASDRVDLANRSSNAAAEVRNSHSTAAMARRWEAMLDSHLPAEALVWKPECRATVPLELAGRWQFSPLLRPLRRTLKRLKS